MDSLNPVVSCGMQRIVASRRRSRILRFAMLPLLAACFVECGGRATGPALNVSAGPGVPIYDAANPDHVLHVFEDWSSYSSVSEVGVKSRVDGGGPWNNDTPSFKSFSTSNNDPWYGTKTLDVDYQQGPGPNQSEGHGLNLQEGTPARFLRASQAKEALIIEWAWRWSGTMPYVGKIADWQPAGGTDRFNYQSGADQLGAQTTADCNLDPLCNLYFANHGATPRFAGLPPNSRGRGGAIARAIGLDVTFYIQNRNWGNGAGLVNWGGNGDDQTGANLVDNTWRRTILRLTLNQNGVMGTGRIEEWLQKAGEPAVKVMEYVGDVGGFDQGLVRSRDASQGGNIWLTDASILHWYNLSAVAGIYDGGATVHLGYFRMWSEPRE